MQHVICLDPTWQHFIYAVVERWGHVPSTAQQQSDAYSASDNVVWHQASTEYDLAIAICKGDGWVDRAARIAWLLDYNDHQPEKEQVAYLVAMPV